MHSCAFDNWCLVASWLSFVISNCEVVTFGQLWCLIVSIPDLCPLSYFPYFAELLLKERIRSQQILSLKRSSHFEKGRNCREALLVTVVSLGCT